MDDSGEQEFDEYQFQSPRDFARQLRKRRTPAERALWDIVRKPEFREWHWRQQMPLLNYVLDIAASSIKVAIEADGESHQNRSPHDAFRDRELANSGWLVLRFTNEEILRNPHQVAAKILNECIGRPRFRY